LQYFQQISRKQLADSLWSIREQLWWKFAPSSSQHRTASGEAVEWRTTVFIRARHP